MATIHNTITRPDGEPHVGALVEITISWDTSVSPIAVDPDTDTTITGPGVEIADRDGYWTTTLVPNTIIEPADSVYKIVEAVGSNSRTYYVSVPDGATPVYWIGDIRVDAPEWEA